jgi:hypothetical protein
MAPDPLGPSGIAPLKTPGTPSWEMKTTRPSPTAVTVPSKAIVELRNLASMLSPTTLE